MTRDRSSFIFFLTLTLTAALAVSPGGAWAGSLLSGYGGPGAGAQALLGSTLLDGTTPPGGGSSNGAAGSGGGPAAATDRAAGQGGAAHSTRGDGANGRGAHGGSAAPGASAEGASAYTPTGSSRPAAGLTAARDSGPAPFGLTGTDVLLLVFVLGVLAITAGLTRGLARMRHNF